MNFHCDDHPGQLPQCLTLCLFTDYISYIYTYTHSLSQAPDLVEPPFPQKPALAAQSARLAPGFQTQECCAVQVLAMVWCLLRR
jgi:hypothetical protein